MKKSIIRNNFNGRPDKACSSDQLRPAMNYIYISDGNMVATNGNILAIIPLKYSEVDGDMSLLDKHYIHPLQYKDILKYDVVKITGPGEVTCRMLKEGFSTVFKFKSDVSIGNFPTYKAVLDFESKGDTYVAVNPRLMNDLISCFDGIMEENKVTIMIQSLNRAIHIHSSLNPDVYGIIMPVMMVSNEEKFFESKAGQKRGGF